MQAAATTRVSLSSSGAEGDNISSGPSISADGRYVAFDSTATNLIPGDTNAACDVFVRDRVAAQTTRVSVNTGGAQGNGAEGSYLPSVSADGRYVAFFSDSSNLVSGDTNGKHDVFVHSASTRYDQTNTKIVKTGTWYTFTTTASYLGSYGRSSTSGASATIYFTGTQLDWIAMKGTTVGMADVYLDGVKKATIDLGAATPSYQVNVWSSGTLPNTRHTVSIVRSSASVLGKYVTLDAVDIWGTISTPPAGSTRYDQTNTNIAKTGTWYTFTTTASYLGSYGRSSTSVASATIYFTGSRLDWITMKGTTTGIADVYLDGVRKATINLAASPAIYKVKVWSTGALPYAPHTVRIVRSSSSAVGKFITLDAVDIWGSINAGP